MNNNLHNIDANSFMGFMAVEGLIPGAVSEFTASDKVLNFIENEISEIAAPKVDFFQFMIEQGQMKSHKELIESDKQYNNETRVTLLQIVQAIAVTVPKLRIKRPYNLGGDLPQAV